MLSIVHMVKAVLWMTPLLLILPDVARADTCEAAQAVFEPTGTRGAFALRASEDQGELLWQLVVQKTGETFPFRTEADTAGQTWLVSLPRDGEDPRHPNDDQAAGRERNGDAGSTCGEWCGDL